MTKAQLGRRTALVAAALTGSISLFVSPLAAASASKSGETTTGADAVTSHQVTDQHMLAIEKKQEVLDKIAGEITEGLSESDRAKIPGFTEVAVDPDHNDLRLYWKGTPPQRVKRILAHLPTGVTTKVFPALYSKAELHAARNKLLHGGKPEDLHIPGNTTPIRITSIGPAVDGSSLQIGYDEDHGTGKRDHADPLAAGVRQSRTDEVKALTRQLTGVSTAAIYKPLSVDLSSRQQDSSPWYGGAALRNPSGGICSSSFAVKNGQGHYMMSTAYHCNGGNGQWSTYWGGTPVGTSDGLQQSASDDALGIDLPSGLSAGDLYDGPASETDGYYKAVSGWGHNNVGDYVCTDGANSGIHTNVQISQTDIGVTGENGVYRPITDLAYATAPDGVAAVNGDSGGPVFAGVNNYSTDEARGVITALDTTITCPTGYYTLDHTVRPPWCLHGVYYVPIYQILSDMNWTLVTG
ncbi:hypothetical protein [Streptantibioticus ferralitis]|uniref:Uncharacterized protein n=1 Tax=Streptantibioticus ferralitis TaxID=236510 RepID=A0ABT5ZCI4_9ACTN|nr:hypothetical protein [Streptantibioticus ferralitis]MDF2261554.1 hypothetical protein [Streptantibioticus ferralitis]